jgi:hypothetical protein
MMYGGECTGLVAGCAACPDGDAPYQDPADCGNYEWCCVPAPAPSNDCEEGDGVCVPLTDESECPAGWGPVWTECSGDGTMCCMPGDLCA